MISDLGMTFCCCDHEEAISHLSGQWASFCSTKNVANLFSSQQKVTSYLCLSDHCKTLQVHWVYLCTQCRQSSPRNWHNWNKILHGSRMLVTGSRPKNYESSFGGGVRPIINIAPKRFHLESKQLGENDVLQIWHDFGQTTEKLPFSRPEDMRSVSANEHRVASDWDSFNQPIRAFIWKTNSLRRALCERGKEQGPVYLLRADIFTQCKIRLL